MNRFFCLLLLLGAAACANKRAQKAVETPAARPPAQFAAAPGRITQVNTQLRFVVVDFNSRTMPSVGTLVSVYRGDQRIGAVKITEPIRTHFATADIVEGDLQVGDEAR